MALKTGTATPVRYGRRLWLAAQPAAIGLSGEGRGQFLREIKCITEEQEQ